MNRPSILHLGKFYPPHPGGMETYLRSLVQYQQQAFDVNVLVANNEQTTMIEQLDGATITRLSTYGSVASMPIVPGFPLGLRGRSDDLVHLHMPNPAAAVAFLLSRHPGKLVITHHGDTLGRAMLRKLVDPFAQAAMRRASAIIVSSQRYADSSDELQPFREKLRIIPFGMDIPAPSGTLLDHAARIRQQYGKNLLVAVGRLVPYKGFATLIEALAKVDATLLLIGKGPLRPELEQQATLAGVRQRVHFLGYVDEVEPYLHAADVFVMPSVTRAESFGLVQIEAMAAGLPVINTDIDSAVPEVSLHDVTGLTVPPADAKALAKAIHALLEDRILRDRLTAAARERAQGFNAAAMAAQHESVYRSILD